LLENAFDRKHISANSNFNPNPKPQCCFWSNVMTSFFEQVYRTEYSNRILLLWSLKLRRKQYMFLIFP